jgi:hypothetical protein
VRSISAIATGSSDVVTIPLSCLFLHTSYFRIYSGYALGEEEKRFAAITWELFNILKENFPSKVSLRQENIEKCAPVFVPLT